MSATNQRQFIDTNVLIYAHDSTAGDKQKKANALLQDLWHTDKGCLSMQVLQEFYVNITRKITSPLPPELAIKIVTALSTWHIHSPKVSDLINAATLQSRHQISFGDAMILISARQLGCQTVWSEDLNAAQDYEGITVRNPFA